MGKYLYTNADIKRAESSEEIKKFIDYWGGIKGIVNETLVFDSKLTLDDQVFLVDRDDVITVQIILLCRIFIFQRL